MAIVHKYYNLTYPNPKGDNGHEFRKKKDAFRDLHIISYRFSFFDFRMLQRVKD